MLRKLFIYGLLLGILGLLVFGYMSYAVVALYEPGQPKISYLFFIPKPERNFDFPFFNYVDEDAAKKQVKKYEDKSLPVPWYLDYEWVVNHSVYHLTLDNRQMEKSPLKKK
ncbi:MAG: hypothetical protein AB1896_15135 [Thermodesulfobacteriota bacterium]